MEKIEIGGASIEELEKVEAYSDKIDFLVGLRQVDFLVCDNPL